MSYRLHTLGLAIALFFLAPVQSLYATTYFVRAGGNNQSDGTATATAFATLVRAMQAVAPVDEVIVGPGVYRGDLVGGDWSGVDAHRISIRGDESGKLSGDAPGPVILQPSNPSGATLKLDRVSHLAISGLTFGPAGDSDVTGQGIEIDHGRDVIIERCSFDQLSRGVAIVDSSNIRIEASVATRCTIGFFLQQTADIRLAHLSVAGCSSQGVMILACGKGQITNSIFASNNISVSADPVSAANWDCDHNVTHGAIGPWGGVTSMQNIYEWNAASGQDRHSVYVVPAFADPEQYDLHIAAHVSWPGGLPGSNVGVALDPTVELDRDGKPLVVRGGAVNAGAYNYPDPALDGGWKKLAAAGPANAKCVRQSAAVYSADGTLLRTLLADAAGVRELYWDGLDDQGKPVAPGNYQVRAVGYDVRIRDDGYFGNSGTAAGGFDPPDATRVVTFSGDRFAVSSTYDESGMILRTFSATGKPVFADNLVDRNFAGLALWGEDILAVAGENEKTHLLRLVLPGNVAPMPTGAMDYPIFAIGEKPCAVGGLAVVGDEAFVSLPTAGIIRSIDLRTGSKRTDLPVPSPADIAANGKGGLWAISGKEIVALTTTGQISRHIDATVKTPVFLAASSTRLAVVDRQAAQIAIIDANGGNVVKTLGRARGDGEWAAVSPDVLRDPRGAAFFPDGRLIFTENGRVRSVWPDSGKIAFDLVAEFLDTGVPHPLKPEFVYTAMGIYRVDPQTNAWQWLVEAPLPPQGPGMPARSVVLGGKPFLAYYNNGMLQIFDVSNPLTPRLALKYPAPGQANVFSGWTYSTVCFGKDGSIVGGSNGTLQLKRVAFTGLDAAGNPQFDFAHVTLLGSVQDPLPRGMVSVEANASDPATGDTYFLATDTFYNKTVPGWGADGTGVGKAGPDGKPLWFSKSSGGNYMSIDCVNNGKEPLILACKSFGGQIDLFDANGLRLTTGNWSFPCNYSIGFVDQRYGLTGYIRPDGKVGAYVEDDAIGRLARARVDGMETITRVSSSIDWDGGAPAGPPPLAEVVAAQRTLATMLKIPKIAPLALDGDWSAWERAGISPQIVCLPSGVGFVRNFPPDLLTTFRQGTALGAVAHDGHFLYVYFLVADDAMHFDAGQPADMWAYNGIELWLEEEQFGLGFLKDATPSLFKYRYHDRAGREWKAGYSLDRQNVWGRVYPDLSSHPLAAHLSSITGVKLAGKSGYAVMAKIPFEEIKLVGGIAGHEPKIADMTGVPGEIIRLGVAIGEVTDTGRQQDYKVNWPAGLMFADPSRSYPFVLEN